MSAARWFIWILPFCAAGTLCAAADNADVSQFRESVAPLLERHCLGCHNDRDRKGGLSLASAAALQAGGESGAVVTAGNPDESPLWSFISGDEPAMPKGAAKLSAAEVEVVRRWIAKGAPWPADLELKASAAGGTWWSLTPLARPVVPPTTSDWVRTPIDAFVLEALEAHGLSHAADADRRTLIRRLTFDLHGLPPTPEEVDHFVADTSETAYEQLVERLLASPRYGERWGRYWLDTVHFGESHGYDKDKPRPNAWPYRDYVIRTFNEDKPYSRFVLEQLAGDVLFPDDEQATIATGFVAAGPWDFVGHVELREDTVDKLIARSNDRDDMVMTAMSTFVSMTVHCARCHDHKFDPIPQADYYRLQAVFAGVERGDRTFASPATTLEREQLADERTRLVGEQSELDERRRSLTSPQLVALDEQIANATPRFSALPNLFDSGNTAPTSPSNGYHSEISATAAATKWVQVDLGESMPIERIRLVPARPTDFADTPGFGFPLRFQVAISDDPKFATQSIIRDQLQVDCANPGNEPVAIPASEQRGRYVRVSAEKLWQRTNDYVFALGELQVEVAGLNAAAGRPVTALDSIEGGRWSTKFLVDSFGSRNALPDLASPDVASRIHAREEAGRELQNLRAARAELAATLVPAELTARLEAIGKRISAIDGETAALAKRDQVYAVKSRQPRPIHLLRRGDVKTPGDEVAPGALACLPSLSGELAISAAADEGARRAALARWIVDPANGLARRSIVNRVWQYHFGAGLVETPNDFGRMGAQPSHPQLLDWLAAEFMAQGESLKSLHRLIVTSSVYRQATNDQVDNARIDAANRYLWRQNRRRLDAEAVRDATLFVSGQLDLTAGGPSVRQFAFKDDHSPIYDYARFDADAPEARRRSVYRFLVRSVPDPLMECLDCADASLLTPKRNTTLTALQALALLNNPFFVRQAEHLAERARAATSDPRAQIEFVYRLALQRLPRDDEAAALAAYNAEHGLANTCRLILNLNEFVFID